MAFATKQPTNLQQNLNTDNIKEMQSLIPIIGASTLVTITRNLSHRNYNH